MKRWLQKLSDTVSAGGRLPLAAQDLASYEKRVTVKTLPNGLTVALVAASRSSGLLVCHPGRRRIGAGPEE